MCLGAKRGGLVNARNSRVDQSRWRSAEGAPTTREEGYEAQWRPSLAETRSTPI